MWIFINREFFSNTNQKECKEVYTDNMILINESVKRVKRSNFYLIRSSIKTRGSSRGVQASPEILCIFLLNLIEEKQSRCTFLSNLDKEQKKDLHQKFVAFTKRRISVIHLAFFCFR